MAVSRGDRDQPAPVPILIWLLHARSRLHESSTSKTCERRRSGGCLERSSTTSTAAPMREMTLRENCRAFNEVSFRPLCAVANADVRPATTVLGTPLSTAVPSRAGRQLADVLSARRRGRGARRRRSRHDLHAFDAVGLPARGRAACDRRTGLVSALSRRRPRRRAGRRSSARKTPVIPRWSSRSTRRSPACANATCATA